MKIPESLRWKATGKTLGQGGQAQIKEVVDKTADSEHTYALKPLGKNKPEQAFKRFYREIAAIKSADHPYIIKIIDHSKEGDEFNYYVMELIPGAESLKSLIDSGNNPFFRNATKALGLFIKLADAIYYWDSKLSIVHRDLSLANVLVLPDESIKIIDFGLVQIEGAETISLVDEGRGTINYMAPECESGANGEVSGKSDLYSAGKILWSAITGRQAFAREDPIWSAMSLRAIFPDHPMTWHLSPIIEQAIQPELYDRPLPYESWKLAEKILDVVVANYPPIELVGKRCNVCGFGELTTEHAWKGWGKGPPEGMIYFVCNHCGFYFAQNKSTHERSLNRKPSARIRIVP